MESFLVECDSRFLAVCISEHWLGADEMAGYCVANYKMGAFFSRSIRAHGGVVVLVRDDVEFVPLSLGDFCVEMDGEVAGVRLLKQKIVLLSVYRSPAGDLDVFLGVLSQVFVGVRTGHDRIVLVGDFNVHFQRENDANARKLRNFMTEFGLHSNFCEPTRFENCLDNIFLDVGERSWSNVIDFSFSDHRGVQTNIYDVSKERTPASVLCIRPTTARGLDDFYRLVRNVDFGSIIDEGVSLGEAVDRFVSSVSELALEAFPTRVVGCGRNNPLRIAWYSPELGRMRDRLRFFSDIFQTTRSEYAGAALKAHRVCYKRAIIDAKRAANDRFIRDHHRSPSAMWRVIRGVTGAPSHHSSPGLTACDFNNFFLSTSATTASSLGRPTDPISLSCWVDGPGGHGVYFEFREISQVAVRSAVDKLKRSKSMDYFGMNSVMLKKIINLVVSPMTRLFNRCITERWFPDVFKLACVSPVYKKGDVEDLSNYRPISILPVIGKVFERLLKDQLVQYLEHVALLNTAQHGFRAGRSTGTAVAAFVERVVECFEGGEYCEVSLLDLSKAFDCISHEVLLRKLYMYNFQPSACALLSSYLSSRKQCVRYNSEVSDFGTISRGVPQGSILGPILFLLYINDFSTLFSPDDTLLYADDTTIFSAGASGDDALRARVGMMEGARRWYDANLLSLNDEKTVHLTFALRHNDDPRQSARFLGVLVDTELTWRPHCCALARRLCSASFALRRLSESASIGALRVAYFALFQSHLVYGLLSWGHCAASADVFAIQRRAVRALDGVSYREDCRPSFVRLNLLTLPSLYILECLKYVLRRRGAFSLQSELHNYNTRGGSNIRHDSLRLTRSRNGMNYFSLRIYNAMDVRLRGLPTGTLLKYVKSYLLSSAFYSLDEFLANPPPVGSVTD